MKRIRFATNVNCGKCVHAITPALNKEDGICFWKVDTEHPKKVLEVETVLPAKHIVSLLEKVGYQAQQLDD